MSRRYRLHRTLSQLLATLALVSLIGPVVQVANAADIHPVSPSQQPTLSVHWRTRLSTLPVMAWKPRVTAKPQLTRDGTGVLFAGRHGVSLLSTASGKLVWEHKTSDAVEGAVVERAGRLYAVTADGQVLTLDRKTGKAVRPSTRLRAAVHAGVVLGLKNAYVVADPGTVHAISLATGKVVWRRAASTSREFLVEGHGAALVVGNLAMAGTAAGRMLALSVRDGAIAWQTKLGGQQTAYTDVDATPRRLGARKIVTSAYNTGLFALATGDGSIRWRRRLTGARQPFVHQSRVYVFDGAGALHVVDENGRPVWARKVSGDPSGALAFAGKMLLIPTEGGLVLARGADGSSLARFSDGFGFAAAPLVVGRRIFAMSNAGVAYSLVLNR